MLTDSNIDVTLIESSGGAFEVTRDGELLFSKKALNRFPTDDELDAMLQE